MQVGRVGEIESMLRASLLQLEAWSFLLYVLAVCIIVWTVLGGVWLFFMSRRILTDCRERKRIIDHADTMAKVHRKHRTTTVRLNK